MNAVDIGSGGASSNINGIAGDLTISAGNSLSTLEVDDQTGSAALTLTNATLTGAGLGLITYSTARTTTINTGADIAVQSTSGNVLTLINAAAGKTVTVGNPVTGAQEVKGQIILGALSGRINLTVDNSADLLSRTVTMSDTALTGLAAAAITYQPTTLGTVMLIGGPQANVNTNGNTFSIQAVAPGTSLTVKTGPGADTVNVGSTTTDLGTIAGALTITGGTGLNTLNINDQGATASETYTLSSVSLVRAGGPTVTFTGMPRIALNGGGGGNVVNVTSSLASSIATVNAGAGINTVNVGNAGSIGGVLGGLVVNGGNAVGALNVNDQNGATDITLATNTIARPARDSSPMARCAP